MPPLLTLITPVFSHTLITDAALMSLRAIITIFFDAALSLRYLCAAMPAGTYAECCLAAADIYARAPRCHFAALRYCLR